MYTDSLMPCLNKYIAAGYCINVHVVKNMPFVRFDPQSRLDQGTVPLRPCMQGPTITQLVLYRWPDKRENPWSCMMHDKPMDRCYYTDIISTVNMGWIVNRSDNNIIVNYNINMVRWFGY